MRSHIGQKGICEEEQKQDNSFKVFHDNVDFKLASKRKAIGIGNVKSSETF